MDWTEITIDTTPEGLEPLCDRLVALGLPSFMIEQEDELDELISGQQKYWDYIDEGLIESLRGINRVRLYVREDETADILALIREGIHALCKALPQTDFGGPEIKIQGRNEKEWELAWKKYYRPTPVGERLIIVPEWEKDYEPAGRVVFLNNPGMSFGTGSHASTRLCIEELEKNIRPGDQVLDLGCGSGILSIIALLLGAAGAVAVDIDKNAVETALKNAHLNSIDTKNYHGLTGDILSDEGLFKTVSQRKYRVVLANIVADVIIALCRLIPALLEKDGIFILSGIISERAFEVEQAAAAAGLEIVKTEELDGWCAMTARVAGGIF